MWQIFQNPILIWFLIGFIFIIVEIFSLLAILVFFCIGAWLTCLTTAIGLTTELQGQLLVFIITSFSSLIVFRRQLKSIFVGSSKNELANLESQFIGKVVPVIITIPGTSATGKVELNGSEWTARSDASCEVGSMVKIMHRDGLTLVVEKTL